MPSEAIPKDGKSWRAFVQENFTAVALFILLIICLALLIILMHEMTIDDKYVTWLEGFTAGIFSAWTLSLKSAATGQHQGDTIKAGDNTVVNMPDPKAAPVADKPEKEQA